MFIIGKTTTKNVFVFLQNFENRIYLRFKIMYQHNGTAHLCVILRYTFRGQLWKGHQEYIFMAKVMSINSYSILLNLFVVFKNTFLSNETKVLVEFTTPFLWCPLYSMKMQKRAVPFKYCRITSLKFLMLLLIPFNENQSNKLWYDEHRFYYANLNFRKIKLWRRTFYVLSLFSVHNTWFFV
jgi:hypothetical protein